MPGHITFLSQFLASYGYLSVVIGTFLEGETIVIMAGFLSHQGYLNIWYVMAAAFAGSVSSDQLLFFLSRYKGASLLSRFPRLASGVQALACKVQTHEAMLILCFRFLYGLRNVTPVFLGVSGVRPALFVPLNIVGALLWAVSFTTAGYYFGEALTLLLGRIGHARIWVLLGIALAGVVFALARRRRKRPPSC